MRALQLVISPNASMSARLAGTALAFAAVPLLGVTLPLAVRGYWPLPLFAIAALLGLAGSLGIALRHNLRREVINFEEHVVRIEHGRVGQGAESATELNRDWMRVSLFSGPYLTSPTRLLLSSLGRSIEIGGCLTDEEREQLAIRLQCLTGAAWQTASRRFELNSRSMQ